MAAGATTLALLSPVVPAAGAPDGEPAAGGDAQTPAPRLAAARRDPSARVAFLLRLGAQPALAAWRETRRAGRPAARATDAARQAAQQVDAVRGRVTDALPDDVGVLYETTNVVAGVAVEAAAADLPALRRLDGVRQVVPIVEKQRSNASAVPFQGGDAAWESYGQTGEGTSIAVVDTGIDYTHADFGGPGTRQAYRRSRTAAEQTDPTGFPTDVVTGGYDLVGDDYGTGREPAVPDANPQDCEGHGTHVAGTAAGRGVLADGSTYDGPYDTTTAGRDLEIGPGMAPGADLLAYRVFGCTGGTLFAAAAVDLATDPDGDGDFSDAADVVNLSLGLDFGNLLDADSLVADEASRLGVTVVAANGNAGDLTQAGGSPGAAVRTLAVASSTDPVSVVDGLVVTDPEALAGTYAASLAQNHDWGRSGSGGAGALTGELVLLTQSGNTDACDPLDTDDAAAVDGRIALVEWTSADDERECASTRMATNLTRAGAEGYVLANEADATDVAIAGNRAIPGVIVPARTGDPLREALVAGDEVRLGGVEPRAVTLDDETADTMSGFSSRGQYADGQVKPDVTAVGASVSSAEVGTGDGALSLDGTSMASPMVAGQAALVRAEHPDWDPEQVKAAIMNTAGVDVTTDGDGEGTPYGPNRAGTGRIDVPASLATDVLAYVGAGSGAVSAGFGPLAVPVDGGETERDRTLTVENTGDGAVTYDLAYVARTEVPGASYEVSPATLTVPPGRTGKATITLRVDPTALTKPIDPTTDREQAGEARQYAAAASGLVELTPTGGTGGAALRVPVHAAPRPASTLGVEGARQVELPVRGGARGTDLTLTGEGFDQGEDTDRTRSLVAGFQLLDTSEEQSRCAPGEVVFCVPQEARGADIQYLGATTDAPAVEAAGGDPLTDGHLFVAVTTHDTWDTPVGQTSVSVSLDVDADGRADYGLDSYRAGGTSDTLVAELYDLTDFEVLDTQPLNGAYGDLDTAVFDNDVVVLPVALSALPELTERASEVRIEAYTPNYYAAFGPGDVAGDVRSGFSAVDVLRPGVTLAGPGGDDLPAPWVAADGGDELRLVTDGAAYTRAGGQGALLLAPHDEPGSTTTVVGARTPTDADLRFPDAPAVLGRPEPVRVRVDAAETFDPITPERPGRVQVLQGDDVVGQGRLGANGRAEVRITPVTPGRRQYRVRYLGDAENAPTESFTRGLVVGKQRPTVALRRTGSNANGVVWRVRVRGTLGPAEGKVALRRRSGGQERAVRVVRLDDGRARIVAPRGRGAVSYVARFLGEARYSAATSPRRRLG